MDKQKQIEEMAKVLDGDCGECYTCKYFESRGINCTYLLGAEYLYNAGYRKIQDNEIVITKDEYESLKKGVHTVSDQQHWLNGYKVGYRDGVVAVGVQTKQALEKIKTELIGEEQK